MAYESLREVISPELAVLPDHKLEAVLEASNIDAEAAEGFFDDLGKTFSSVAKAAAPIAKVALPIAGGIAGTFIGGPAGAMIGSQLGQLAGGAIGAAAGGQSLAGVAKSALPAVAGIAGTALGGPVGTMVGAQLGQLAGGAAPLPQMPAAGRLLQTITRPETMQALSSMLLGQLGRPNVQVGSTPVPVTAFTNLLGILANQAASEFNATTSAASESVPKYMADYAGEPKGDPAVAADRANALYELLENTEIEQESSEASEASEASEGFEAIEALEYLGFESEMEATEGDYDAMDFAEFYESVESESELEAI